MGRKKNKENAQIKNLSKFSDNQINLYTIVTDFSISQIWGFNNGESCAYQLSETCRKE